jgi:HK97 family phage major capsid protein
MQQINVLGQQPLYISDLFAQGTTQGDVVRYVRESTFTNAATAVLEGGAKPEASLDLGVVDALVRKVAVWSDVTEEMLMDFQQTQGFVNARLGYMVQAREDQHLMTGLNASNQIVGILNTSGIQTIAVVAGNVVDSMLIAKARVEGSAGSGFATPDAFVINPINWLSIRLTKDFNGQYLFGGPGYAPYGVGGYSNVGSMWGLPVVSTVSITAGTAVCGAFRTAAQIFRRLGLTLKTTNSDGTKFQSNILTILAEQRLALAVYQPNKFCTVTAIP